MPLPQPGQTFQHLFCCSWSLWPLRKSQIDATGMLPQPNYIPGRRSATSPFKSCASVMRARKSWLSVLASLQLEAVAAAKWGSVEQAEAEREKRSEKKRQRALEATQEGAPQKAAVALRPPVQAALALRLSGAAAAALLCGECTSACLCAGWQHSPWLSEPLGTHTAEHCKIQAPQAEQMAKLAALQSVAALPAACSYTAQGRRAQWLQHVPRGIAVSLLSTPGIPVHAMNGSFARCMSPHFRAQPSQQGALRGGR